MERRSRPRGNPNWTPGRDTGQLGKGKYGDARTMVVRIPCEAFERVAAICREYEVAAPASADVPEQLKQRPA